MAGEWLNDAGLVAGGGSLAAAIYALAYAIRKLRNGKDKGEGNGLVEGSRLSQDIREIKGVSYEMKTIVQEILKELNETSEEVSGIKNFTQKIDHTLELQQIKFSNDHEKIVGDLDSLEAKCQKLSDMLERQARLTDMMEIQASLMQGLTRRIKDEG